MDSKEALDNIVVEFDEMGMICSNIAYKDFWETELHFKEIFGCEYEIIMKDLKQLEQLEKENQELKELVEFLIKHLYVAPELLELRVAPKHNHIWDGWRHNGIKVQNDDFWKHIKLINKLKKEIGNYE